MANQNPSGVTMYDIRNDKTEMSLLGMIKQGLGSQPKTLPTLLLYDEQGLKLFEQITYLDEYYLTNAEIEALTTHADSIAEHIPSGSRVIELGSGNLRKVRLLLEALERAEKHIEYFALDLSYPELERTFAEVETDKFKFVKFNGFHGTYDDGLAWLAKSENKDKVNVIISLGSSIGNFTRDEAAEFLKTYSRTLEPTDRIIIGMDATTDSQKIFAAYNDREGITEKFYRNGLAHANSILGYEAFKQEEWQVLGEYVEADNKHMASYVALADVEIEGFGIKEGERMPFEHAYKFAGQHGDQLWHDAALIPTAVYTDSTGNHELHVLKPSNISFPTDPQLYAPAPVPNRAEWDQLWTAWDAVTRSMVPRDELMEKPIKLRNSLIFYLGHIPTFADIHFTKATGAKPTHPKYYQQIFERGIDPDVDDPSKCHAHSEVPDDWPPMAEILQYQLRVRNRIVKSIESGQAQSDKRLARGLALAFEHEALHLETFLYMLLQSDKVLPPAGYDVPDFKALAKKAEQARAESEWCVIPAAKFVVGADDVENNEPPERYFLWDNERPSRLVHVGQFQASTRPVSNGDYAAYLEATNSSKLPAAWTTMDIQMNGINGKQVNGHTTSSETNGDSTNNSSAFFHGKAVRTVFGKIPLELALDWPVQASYDELAAFAKWSDGRIPTFEELKSIYHYVQSQEATAAQVPSPLVPAVNGHLSNNGVTETPPSNGLSNGAGEKASKGVSPNDLFINLSGANIGFKNWYTTPITDEPSRLRGQGDVGGLWEWTSYSADFFDEKHNICLGGSWATVPRIAGRKSFVNWYQRNYPYTWCTARLVRDAA